MTKEQTQSLCSAINKVVNAINDARTTIFTLLTLSEQQELPLEEDVIDLFDEIKEPEPVKNIAPMTKSYTELLRPTKKSRWQELGQVPISKAVDLLKAEMPTLTTSKFKAACIGLGISVYEHAHNPYFHHSHADTVVRYLRNEGRA